MLRKYNKRGLTLIELILASLLVSVVVLTGLSMEMGMRKIFSSSDFSTQLNSEAAAILAFVTKKISSGIGAQNYTNMSVYASAAQADGTSWFIGQDTDQDGVPEPGVDIAVAFRYFTSGANNHQIWYYQNSAAAPTLSLTNRATNFAIGAPTAIGFSAITVTLRRDPDNAANATNPEVTFNTSAQYRSASFS
jgi:prepilin-type N-terminal cleavage/methylation domain-containing protein